MDHNSRLRRRAASQHGYFTLRQALDTGVTRHQLARMRSRGEAQRIDRGLYRYSATPRGDYDSFAEAVLRVGPDAYLADDAVLALHRLGSVQPLRIRVGTPHRIRKDLPGHIEVITRSTPRQLLTRYHGIPSVAVAQAIIDCRGLVPEQDLLQALAEAEDRELIDRARSDALRSVIRLLPVARPVRSNRTGPRLVLGSARVTTRRPRPR